MSASCTHWPRAPSWPSGDISFTAAAGPVPSWHTRNRGKATDGRLETRSFDRLLRILGDKIGIHVRTHGLRHTSISQASALGQREGIPLEKIRAHSRHATVATLVKYTDEHRHQETAQKTG